MSKYLYGASIQGIQSFIFQTNKLREIVGGSELVEEICKELVFKVAKIERNFSGLIQNAAGNVKVVFDENEMETLDRLVMNFPRAVIEKVPGITISQAVVKFEDTEAFKDIVDCLERKLKTQRSKPSKPIEVAFMGLARDRRAGGVGVFISEKENHLKDESNEVISSSTKTKRASAKYGTHSKLVRLTTTIEGPNEEVTKEITEVSKGFFNNWIAVVHVDGNGVGKLIQELSDKLQGKGYEENKEAFGHFSQLLEASTESAAKEAFDFMFPEDEKGKHQNLNEDGKFPFRPIICGGDDLTVIIRADLALRYTQKFIEAFQKRTKVNLEFLKKDHGIDTFSDGLTACAGIAYIKNSYPLHYAMDLAEALCKDAKKLVKDKAKKQGEILPESALAFYKVQESFTDDLSELQSRTLLAQETLSYYGGPYLHSDIEKKLIQPLELIKQEAENKKEKSKAVGKLRSIVSETFEDFTAAIFSLERMEEVNKDFYKDLELNDFKEQVQLAKDGVEAHSSLFDLISLHSFNYGKDGGN